MTEIFKTQNSSCCALINTVPYVFQSNRSICMTKNSEFLRLQMNGLQIWISPNLNRALLYRALHIHPLIVLIWLKYCWKRHKTKTKSSSLSSFYQKDKMSQCMRLWYLSHRRPAKAQASLRICAVSPEPLLFAHLKNGNRRRARRKIRHLAPTDGCACTFEEWVYGGRKVP